MTIRALLLNSTLLTVALSYGLLFTIALRAGLLGLWLLLLLCLSLSRFGYAVLRAVAQGRAPPPPDIESMNPVSELPLLLHFAVFPGAIGWYQISAALGSDTSLGWVGTAICLLMVAIFPASAGLMAITGSLWCALNPFRIAAFIRELGTAYLSLLAGCVVLFLLSLLLVQTVSSGWGLAHLLLPFIPVWAFLALFALIGLRIFASREVFDIPGLAEEKRQRQARWAREDRFSEWQRSLDVVYANWRSDQHREAYLELRQLIDREQQSIDVFAWLFEKTLEWEDKRCAMDIGRRFVHRLLEDNNETQALGIVLRCRRHTSPLVLVTGDAARLSNYARNNGQLGLADELTSWEN